MGFDNGENKRRGYTVDDFAIGQRVWVNQYDKEGVITDFYMEDNQQFVSLDQPFTSAAKIPFYLIEPINISREDYLNLVDSVNRSKDKYDYVNPSHYKQFSKETIDMMVNIWGADAVATHCEITAFKYRMRLGSKPDQPIERDLEKAEWYLKKAFELRNN